MKQKIEHSLPNKQELGLEQMLEKILTSEAAIKINEGHNGVIVEVDLSEMPDEIKAYFLPDYDDDEEDKIAVKLLKIRAKANGANEFAMQQKARQALKTAKVKGVSIPKPLNFHEIGIEEEATVEHLEQMGIKVGPDRKIEIIAMDLVKGTDLGTMVFEEYVRQHQREFTTAYPDLEMESFLRNVRFSGLVDLVYHLAGFKPKYHYFDDSPDAVVERNVISRAISEGVAYSGIVQEKHIQAVIGATKAMHEAGVYHRDLHLRNIMIDENGQVQIVDFGTAIHVDPKNKPDDDLIYQAKENKSHMNDGDIIPVMHKLAKTETNLQKEKDKELLGDYEEFLEKIAKRKSQDWQEYLKLIKQGEEIEQLIGWRANKFAITVDLPLKATLLIGIARAGRRAEVAEYLHSIIEKEDARLKQYQSDKLIRTYRAVLDRI